MDRLEDVVRACEPSDGLVLLLRGGEDTTVKLLRQAGLLAQRYSYADLPARGLSVFAARGSDEEAVLLGSKLRTYRQYRRVSGPRLARLAVLLPTFQSPHWTILLQSPTLPARSERELVSELLDILGPAAGQSEVPAIPIEEVSAVGTESVLVDLEVDFHNEDETGYIWAWLSEARDRSVIAPERIVVVGDDDAVAMARVVDLIEHENGTIVHLEVLPGSVAQYVEAVARAGIPA